MVGQKAPPPPPRQVNDYLYQVTPYVSENPHRLLDLEQWKQDPERYFQNLIQAEMQRPIFVDRYAWAVPNEAALETLSKLGPIVEIGAGTGYWASLLQARGVDIKPFDRYPPDKYPNHYHSQRHVWTHVLRGGPEKAATYPERTLLICWPPLNAPVAYEALSNYRGRTVVYIGEFGGCTGDRKFHAALDRDFTQIETVNLPNWPNIHDRLMVWRRKRRKRGTVSP